MSLNIGLVGCGHMGKIHLEKLQALKNVKLIGIVDINHAVVKHLSKLYAVPYFTNYYDLVGLTDAVIIATPTLHHFQIAKTFLEHGSHVFIEKPITFDTQEARRLILVAKKKNLILQVGHLERYNPAFHRARSYIKEPLFIDALRISPFTGRSTDIDVILDLMIHDIDLVLSLVQSTITDIRAHGATFMTDKLDIAHARIEFGNGSIAHLQASRVSPERKRILTVFERDRFCIINLLSGKLFLYTKHKESQIKSKEYESETVDSVKEELTEFIRSIKNGKTPRVIGEDALKALSVANRIKQYIEKHTSPSH